MAAGRFRSLDAWRGICALLVALVHFQSAGPLHHNPLVAGAGRLVDFFFVLSGFVIAYAYAGRINRGGIGDFLGRRLARLWPLHAATLAATIAMALGGGLIGLSVHGWLWEAIPAQLTLTHAWNLFDRLTWNGPSWSISAELAAYLTFALLAWRLSGARLVAACAATMLAGLALVLTVAPDGMGSTYGWSVARCLYGFMAGALAWMARDRLGWRPRGEIAALAAAMLGVAALPRSAGMLVVPLFAWVVLVFANDEGPVSRLLQRPVPQMLGRLSYSIYMVHYLVALAIMTALTLSTPLVREIAGTATIVAPWWLTEPLTLAYLAAVVLVSKLTFAWIEQPRPAAVAAARRAGARRLVGAAGPAAGCKGRPAAHVGPDDPAVRARPVADRRGQRCRRSPAPFR